MFDEELLERNETRAAKYAENRVKKTQHDQNDQKQSRRKRSTKKPDLSSRHSIELSSKNWNFLDYVKCELKHFDRFQSALEKQTSSKTGTWSKWHWTTGAIKTDTSVVQNDGQNRRGQSTKQMQKAHANKLQTKQIKSNVDCHRRLHWGW